MPGFPSNGNRLLLQPSWMSKRNRHLSVVLADDHPIVRAGIRAELEKIPDVSVAAEASDGREALELVKHHQPDLVFMDISMRGLNGLEATARIKKLFPDTVVVILSMHQNEEYFWQALKSGASGYLLKKAATTELAEALRRVADGEIFASKEISNRLTRRRSSHQLVHHNTPLDKLTERQRDILQLVAEGHTTKSIGAILKLSPKTVEYHRLKVMEHLNIFDVPGLVRFALRCGLISED